jgi:2-C-methyl-D-erythritol 4-phosphate cytidylyltransferase
MAGDGNKVFLEIDGVPMLDWSLRAFDQAPSVDRVTLVAARSDLDVSRKACARFSKPSPVIEGGATRHESEFLGLVSLAADIEAGEIDLVLVHDAVRPFASAELVERLVANARRAGAVIPGVPVASGLVTAADGQVTGYPSSLYAVQTPQAFEARLVLDAHRRAQRERFEGTDTASVVERAGVAVEVIDGSFDNIKVTTPDDLVRARAIAEHLALGGSTTLLTADTFGA